MSYYLVYGKPTTPETERAAVDAGERPRHLLLQVRDLLDAQWLSPAKDEPVTAGDKLKSRLFSFTPQQWAFGRTAAAKLKDGDVAFCNGEDSALPLALGCLQRGLKNVHIFQQVHNLGRPRTKLLLNTLLRKLRDSKAKGVKHTFLVNALPQVPIMRAMGFSEQQVIYHEDQCDTQWWTPGDRGPGAAPTGDGRKTVVSVGAEMRDDATLWEAVRPLDVELVTTGWSLDAAGKSSPEELVANSPPDTKATWRVTGRIPWTELRELYRDASVMAVSVQPSLFCAGLTCIMEASSVGRPVVFTASQGLEPFTNRPDAIKSVPLGDVAGLRAEIEKRLADPSLCEDQGRRAHEMAQTRFNSDAFLDHIRTSMRNRLGGNATF